MPILLASFIWCELAHGAAPIDLLTLAWTAESDKQSAQYGSSVASAGDVNGDGYGDVVVGADHYANVIGAEGRAFLYLGSATGLGATAAWTAGSDEFNAEFGSSVASAGDVNGDGYDDVLVGAEWGASLDTGRASLYLGSAAGLDLTPAWTAESGESFSHLGQVSSAGDVNGDGYDDVVVTWPFYDGVFTSEGRASVYLGSAAGLESDAAWTTEGGLANADLSVATGAGDVNGDSYDDVIVGAFLYAYGRAELYLGSSTGLGPDAAWTAESTQDQGVGFANSVSSAGDVNADGYDDVIVGAFLQGSAEGGRAYVYLGSAVGLELTAAWIAESNQASSQFGWSVSSAGDVNDDGYDDVLVGADWFDNGSIDEGRAYLYLGSSAGLEVTAAWTAESDQPYANLGRSVASAGDVNGDGFTDVVLGAPLYDNGSDNEGRAYVYAGTCIDSVDSDADTIGDACDACPGFDDLLDVDVDGVSEGCDVCPGIADPDQGDDDEDGLGDACDPCPLDALDADTDGACAAEDCNDTDANVYPGATELCDGQDNACAGSIPTEEEDLDGDGSFVCAGDCDDSDDSRSPAASESCNAVDDDCDGMVPDDELDSDGDGSSLCGGDCDDSEGTASPALIEVCGDNVDNDCDGVADQECAGEADGACGGCNGTGRADLASLAALALLSLRLARPLLPRTSVG